MTPPTPGAQDARHGVLPVGASLMSAPHDGLLLLAALTGHRSLLTIWLRVEGAPSERVRPAAAWGE